MSVGGWSKNNYFWHLLYLLSSKFANSSCLPKFNKKSEKWKKMDSRGWHYRYFPLPVVQVLTKIFCFFDGLLFLANHLLYICFCNPPYEIDDFVSSHVFKHHHSSHLVLHNLNTTPQTWICEIENWNLLRQFMILLRYTS